MYRYLFIFGLLVFSFLNISCDCEEEFLDIEESDLAFKGLLIDLETTEGSLLRATFQTAEEQFIEIFTPSDESLCGYPFEEGIEYVVFAYYNYEDGFYGEAESYYTTLCTYTMTLEEWNSF